MRPAEHVLLDRHGRWPQSKAACFRFLNRLGLIKRAVNLGDTKSIAVHPASTI